MGEKVALIIGATGQDGSYLAQQLFDHGWRVHGTGRQADRVSPPNWTALGIEHNVNAHRLDPVNKEDVRDLIARIVPDAIFVLAAQSSVGLSFRQPAEAIRSNVDPLLAVLEAVRAMPGDPAIVYAASGECFGETTQTAPATETTPFDPLSPYAAGKCMAVEAARIYRDTYAMRVSIAYLFGHESPLRPPNFVFGKVLEGIRAIREGSAERITLGDLSVVRDWGWAADYASAMASMSQLEDPVELVLGTGKSVRLGIAVKFLLEEADLSYDLHVVDNTSVAERARQARSMHSNSSTAAKVIGWTCSTGFPGLASLLLNSDFRD